MLDWTTCAGPRRRTAEEVRPRRGDPNRRRTGADAAACPRPRDQAAASAPVGAARYATALALALALLLAPAAGGAQISIEGAGTDDAYFAQGGRPLLSFGGGSDFMVYTAEDAFDYRRWADWAAAHGMNHLRAYPPMSWRYIEHITRVNGGSEDAVLFPYEEAPGSRPGARKFDLNEFNEAYWDRFRSQLEYLESKGIVVHLLMINGWQFEPDDLNWDGHFFNPRNNVNAYTIHLSAPNIGRFRFYEAVAKRNRGLVAAQKRWFQKIVDETHDLDNVYYDLVHEIDGNRPTNWRAVQEWVEVMAATVRERHAARTGGERPIVLGMDTGGLTRKQREWVFSRAYFDIVIYGKKHTVAEAREWRQRHGKPYVPQEAWDDNQKKYSLACPGQRVHARKYAWKFVMQKVQQIDFYYRALPWRCGDSPPSPYGDRELWLNYDPNGVSGFEDDARVLRAFWDDLVDYPDLDFEGTVASGPGQHRYVLSSDREAVAYLSSATGAEGIAYGPQELALADLSLADGPCNVEVVDPAAGLVATTRATARGGEMRVSLPAFVDDLAVHISCPAGRDATDFSA